MAISNPIPTPASEGILRYLGIPDSGHPGYLSLHDGKWIIVSSDSFRSIGNAQSGASIAEDWLLKLFSFIHTYYSTPVYAATGQLSSKETLEGDWNAGKRLQLPDFRGRVLMTAGTGQGLTQRIRGALIGEERHVLTIAEMPNHDHKVDHVSSFNSGGTQYGGSSIQTSPQTTTLKTGGGQAHNNIQPSIVESLWISAGVL